VAELRIAARLTLAQNLLLIRSNQPTASWFKEITSAAVGLADN